MIVCDGSTSALDVSIQAQVLNLLKSLQWEYGLTYLFISHDLSVVLTIANRIGVLHRGKRIEEQSAIDLFAAPQQAYTQSLLQVASKIDLRL